ncbi:ABC transporter ATP-binding protein [Maricurvus nonylphenolicus]|uniref:ABC transporter ATP-binding protein n=1 Tax=Maricurvus nonylphenolicus TaxID=1008307 RepID=UPI0036F3A378
MSLSVGTVPSSSAMSVDVENHTLEAEGLNAENHKLKKELGWIFAFVMPHRASVLGLALVSVFASSLVLVQPWLTKELIDSGLLAKDFSALTHIAMMLLGVGFISTLISGLTRYWHTLISAKILFRLRESVYRHLQTLSPAFYARQRLGDVLSRVDGDVAEIQRFALDGIFAAFSGVIGLIGSVGLLFWLNWRLALIALILLPVEWLYLRMMRPRVEKLVRKMRERSADLSSFLVETLGSLKFIQTVAREEEEARRLSSLNRGYLRNLLQLQMTEFATQAVPSTLTSASRALVFLVGGYWVIEGQMALGALIAFSTYLGMAVGPVQTLLGLYLSVSRMRVSLSRVQALTQATADINRNTQREVTCKHWQGQLAFEDVVFTYPGSQQTILRGANVQIPAGSKVGIHGPSGTGKTTLVDLLLRHYDPQQGRITIDGYDLRDCVLADWRRQLAVVAQDIVLLRGTLAENIRYANPAASDEALMAAVEQAQLTELVATLPDGIDTPIGERGMNLSGGQRQRIALARALLQKPTVLILDEATSAVDLAAERQVMDVIDRQFADCTRLVVSHRETPLDNADWLLTIEQGRIVMTSVDGGGSYD